MAKLDPNPASFPSFDESGFKGQEEALEKLYATSAAIDFTNPKADLTGAVVKFPIADGYAVYVVSKNSPLTVQHVPFGDAWQIYAPTIRGLNRADILEQLRRRKAVRDLFGKKG